MKTIEQRAREYVTQGMNPCKEVPINMLMVQRCHTPREMERAYIKGATDALDSLWQPFTPDNVPWYTDILCRSDKGDVAVLQLVETKLPDGGRQLTTLPHVKCKIVAWMPIPQYQGKEETE